MGGYFTEEQENLILHLYVNEGRGQLYCAKACGSTNVNKVKEILKKHNIPIRDFAHAAAISNQDRAYKKNEAYFDIPSSNMAWLLGFLASDGSISSSDNNIKLGLAKKDREILERIRQEVQIENEIGEYTTTSGSEVVELRWSSKRHKEALAKYAITPKKTFTLIPPVNLPYKYWIDYIRGYFDGDGSISHLNNGAWRWSVCCAMSAMLEWIVEYFYSEYNIPKVKIQYDKNHGKQGLYQIQYSTASAKKIHSILYTSNSLYLQRKKDMFDKITI